MILFIVYVDITHTTKESTASIRTCDIPRHFGTESTVSRYPVLSTPSLVSGYGRAWYQVLRFMNVHRSFYDLCSCLIE